MTGRDEPPRARSAIWIAAAIVLVGIAIAVAFRLRDRPAPNPPTPSVAATPPVAPKTCAELEPLHQQTLRETREAFEAALGAQDLAPIMLDELPLGSSELPGDVDRGLPHPVVAWQPFGWIEKRKPRGLAIVSPVRIDQDHERETDEFVVGANRIWHVKRVPQVRTITRAVVRACARGCWGSPGHGDVMAPLYYRRGWLIPAGLEFAGEREIRYDAPTIEEDIVDLGCGDPP